MGTACALPQIAWIYKCIYNTIAQKDMPYLAKTYRMGEEAHMAQLEKYCRACGHKVQKAQAKPYSPYLCSEYKRYLEVGFWARR